MAGNSNNGWGLNRGDPNDPSYAPPASLGSGYMPPSDYDPNADQSGGAGSGDGMIMGNDELQARGASNRNWYSTDDYNKASQFSYGGLPGYKDQYGNIIPGTSGADAQQRYFQGLGSQWAGMKAPQIDYSNANVDRNSGIADWQANYQQQQGVRNGDQSSALGLLGSAARGDQPSVAQLQQSQGIDAAVRSQQALAASARGPAAMAAAQQNAAGNTATIQQQGVAQNSMLRAQEMAQARGQYSEAANAMRGQDMQLMMGMRAQELQQQGLDANQAQQQADMEMRQRQLGLQGQLGFEGLGFQVQNAQLGAGIAAQGADFNQWNAQNALNQHSTDRATDIYMGAANAGGSLIGHAASDARVKTGIHTEAAHTAAYVTSDARAKAAARAEGFHEGQEHALAAIQNPAQRHAMNMQLARGSEMGAQTGPGAPVVAVTKPAHGAEPKLAYGASVRPGPVVGQDINDYGARLIQKIPELPPQEQEAGVMAKVPVMPMPAPAQRPAPVMASLSDARAKQNAYEEGLAAAGQRMGAQLHEQFAQSSPMEQKAAQEARGAAPAQMMEQLQPYSYNYKQGVPGEDTGRRRFGVMAQDLQKSPMGASIVEETPNGKMLDARHATGVHFAAEANLHQRLKGLEAERDERAAYRRTLKRELGNRSGTYWGGIEHENPYGEDEG